MKLLFLLVSLLCAGGLYAQDTLVLTDGTIRVETLRAPTVDYFIRDVVAEGATGRRTRHFTIGEIDRLRLRNGEQYRAVNVKLRADDTGERRPVRRLARVLFAGDLTLLRVDLRPQEYDGKVGGAEPYLYLVEKDAETYQLDLLQAAGRPGDYVVSRRYRNVLGYVVAGCEPAVAAAKSAGFNDRALLEVMRRAADCRATPAEQRYAVALGRSIRSYHGLAVHLVVPRGEDVTLDGASWALGYLGDYGLWGQGHLRLLTGLGVARLKYNSRRGWSGRGYQMYGQLLAAYAADHSDPSVRIGLGYTLYNELGGRRPGAFLGPGRRGYYTIQLCSQGRHFGVLGEANVNVKDYGNLAPQAFLKLGASYRL